LDSTEIKGRSLHGFLLLASEPGEAVGKRVRNPEFHQFTRNTFINFVAKMLMTFTAIRPDSGLSNGREDVTMERAQASSLTRLSALS